MLNYQRVTEIRFDARFEYFGPKPGQFGSWPRSLPRAASYWGSTGTFALGTTPRPWGWVASAEGLLDPPVDWRKCQTFLNEWCFLCWWSMNRRHLTVLGCPCHLNSPLPGDFMVIKKVSLTKWGIPKSDVFIIKTLSCSLHSTWPFGGLP